jgi:hypothetical protein
MFDTFTFEVASCIGMLRARNLSQIIIELGILTPWPKEDKWRALDETITPELFVSLEAVKIDLRDLRPQSQSESKLKIKQWLQDLDNRNLLIFVCSIFFLSV